MGMAGGTCALSGEWPELPPDCFTSGWTGAVVRRVLAGRCWQPFTAQTCHVRSGNFRHGMCRSGISFKSAFHYAKRSKGLGSCPCPFPCLFSWQVLLYAVWVLASWVLFWMRPFCRLRGWMLLSRLGAKHEQGWDFHATMRELVECVVHRPFVTHQVDDCAPDLPIGMQELRGRHSAKRKGRIWLREAHACDLLIQGFGMQQMHCLAQGQGIAEYSLDAMQPTRSERSAVYADFRRIVKKAWVSSCASVRIALCVRASTAS